MIMRGGNVMAKGSSHVRLTRRDLLKAGASGISASALAAILAACGGSTSPTATTGAASTKPTAAPTTASGTASAGTTSAQGAAPTSATASRGGTLKLASNAPPPDFNPLSAVSAAQAWFFYSVMPGLTQADPDQQTFVPDVAESWEIGADGSTYTFKIRANAKWHDGQPVTAQDVAYTYMMALLPDTGSKKTSALALIKGAADVTAGKTDQAAGISVVDDRTITFTMEFPNALFMYQTLLSILPKHILGSVTPKELSKHPFFTSAPIGAGPFKFVKWVPDQYIEVQANPDYHFGAPKLDKIVYNIIKSPDTIDVAMGREEVDMPIFDGGAAAQSLYQKYITDKRFRLIGTQGSAVVGYGFNFRKPYLQDPRIHQAFLYALDRKKLIDRFTGGNGTIVNSFMTHAWYQKPEWANLYPYDPEKAKALLKDAGWDSNRTVNVSLITLADEDSRSQVAAEQQMLAQAGFKVNFQEMELPVWVSTFYESHDYELVRVTFGVFPDPDGFLSFHIKSDSKNAFGYANPALDKLIDQGERTVDQGGRAKIYQQINEEMLKSLPVAPLYLNNLRWILNRKWSVPKLANVPIPTQLNDVPVLKSFVGGQDVWGYHQEGWSIT